MSVTPRTILFAEDDPDDALLLRRTVARFFTAHQLQVVPDGQQAIRYLKGDSPYHDRGQFPFPQLVLLDINLPRTDGLQVLSWIREQSDLRGMIVLILTGSDAECHRRRAHELHANSFLKKRPLLLLPEASKGILEYWLHLNQFPRVQATG